MNLEIITLEECMFLNENKGKEIVINDGKIVAIIDGGNKNER